MYTEGGILLVERSAFQQIGGFNELLNGWGYEDTDLIARLEAAGFGRVEMRGARLMSQPDNAERRVGNVRVKEPRLSLARNRLIADYLLRRWGAVQAVQKYQGWCEWVEVNGSRVEFENAAKQDWVNDNCLPETLQERVRKMANDYDELDADTLSLPAARLPLVSIVVPCKDHARFIMAAIESILSQDYPNIECIVVDGSSSDATLDILRLYENRITWQSRPDRGPFDAINEGWQQSKGEIIAWLNADDILEAGAVRVAVAHLLARPDLDVVYGYCGALDERGNLFDLYTAADWDLRTAVLYCDHIINQAASFMRRSAVEAVGWLTPAWCHDHDLWLRMAANGCVFERIPVHLASALVWPANVGNVPSITAPQKIALTKRFFDLPNVPADIVPLKRRAMSNSYLRGLYYVLPRLRSDWLLGVRLLAQALAAEPLNAPYVLWQVVFRLGRPLAQPLLAVAWKVRYMALRLLSWPDCKVARLTGHRARAGRRPPVDARRR